MIETPLAKYDETCGQAWVVYTKSDYSAKAWAKYVATCRRAQAKYKVDAV